MKDGQGSPRRGSLTSGKELRRGSCDLEQELVGELNRRRSERMGKAVEEGEKEEISNLKLTLEKLDLETLDLDGVFGTFQNATYVAGSTCCRQACAVRDALGWFILFSALPLSPLLTSLG